MCTSELGIGRMVLRISNVRTMTTVDRYEFADKFKSVHDDHAGLCVFFVNSLSHVVH